MNKNELIMRIPNPFDESAQIRLIHMGIANKDGQLNQDILSIFTMVFTGLFFDDICDFYNDIDELLMIHKVFTEFYEKEDYQHMYLFFSVQYDNIRKSLPDPVWWIAGSTFAVKGFMTQFMDCFTKLMADTGFIDEKKEADK